jgi:hypothetical protein
MQERGRASRIVLLTVAWMALVAAAVLWGVGEEQSNLEAAAKAELAAAGIPVQYVDFEGRDAVLGGPESIRAEAETVVASLRGVRRVRWLDPDEIDTRDDLIITTSTVASTGTVAILPPTETSGHADTATFAIRIEMGRVTMQGSLPDAGSAARLAAAADRLYAPLLDNDLVIDSSLDPVPWVGEVAGAISALPMIGVVELSITGSDAVLSGFAPDEAAGRALQTAVEAALGPDLTLTGDVTITGLAPPFLEGTMGEDGILRVAGTVASMDVADFVLGLFVDAYGKDHIVDGLTINSSVDTSFALFRLPALFVLLRPYQNWHFTVSGNDLTGEIRGGPFPTGGTELTTEMIPQVPAVVTIMTEHPELVVTVLGHTDDVGSQEANQLLSEERATAGAGLLVRSGIPADRVLAVGYGDTRPIADNDTAAGRLENRRIEFTFAPQGGPS